MFSIVIKTNNASFGDTEQEKMHEIAKILKKVIIDIEADSDHKNIILTDSNGNTVGNMYIS